MTPPGERARDADPRALPRALVLAALAFTVVKFAFWASEATYFGTGLRYLLNFDAHPGASYLGPFVWRTAFYPPLYYLCLYLLHPLFGFHFVPYLAANLLFPIGGAAYTYFAAKRFGGREGGAVAFCAFLLVPAQSAFTATLVIEAPLLLFVPAFLFHALASDRARHAGHAAAAGAYFALGMLTKWSYFAYVAVPALCFAAEVFLDPAARRPRLPSGAQVRNLGIAVGMAAVLAGPWYLGPFDPSLFRASAKNDPTFPVYSRVANLRFNLDLLWEFGGRWALVALSAVAAFAAVAELPLPRALLWAAVLVASPLAFFTLPGHLEDRYLWPVFPGIALAVGIAWRTVRARVRWVIVRGAVLIALVLVLGAASWTKFVAERGNPEPLEVEKNYARGAPFWERADADVVLAAVDDALAAVRVPTRALVVATNPFMVDPYIDAAHLQYARRRDPRYGRLTVRGTTMFRYPLLMRAARAGEVDVLLVDADRWRRYVAKDFDPADDVIRNVMARPYTDQSSGEEFPPVDLEGFRADLRFVEENFRRARELKFPKNTVWVLVNEALYP